MCLFLHCDISSKLWPNCSSLYKWSQILSIKNGKIIQFEMLNRQFLTQIQSKSCSNQLQVKCAAGAVLSMEGRAVVLLSKSLSTSPEVYECLISCLSVITSDTWNTSLISIDTFLKHCGSTLHCFSKRQSNGSEKSEQYLIVQNKNNSIFTTVFF